MERFTISLDDLLAHDFDAWIARHGYLNRSEAVRDLIRERLGTDLLQEGHSKWCFGTITYVYDRSEPTVRERVLKWQHDHHDLMVTSQSTPLDHEDCLETVTVRGRTPALVASGAELVATRGVRHGNMHFVPMRVSPAHTHHGASHDHHSHRHLTPLS